MQSVVQLKGLFPKANSTAGFNDKVLGPPPMKLEQQKTLQC